MGVPLQGNVGPAPVSDGSAVTLRLGRTGEQIVTELHGKYYESTYRGNLFHATTATTGVALVAAGTTAGFALANPAGSGKNLSLIRVSLGLVSGTYVVGTIMHGVNSNVVAAAVTGAALTAIPGLVGSNSMPAGKAFTTATLPAAQTSLRPFAIKNATAATGSDFQLSEDIDGQIMLAPGATWSLFVVGADTTPLEIVAVSWEEALP